MPGCGFESDIPGGTDAEGDLDVERREHEHGKGVERHRDVVGVVVEEVAQQLVDQSDAAPTP